MTASVYYAARVGNSAKDFGEERSEEIDSAKQVAGAALEKLRDDGDYETAVHIVRVEDGVAHIISTIR